MSIVEIFIPVLWVCINSHCEFMQSQEYYVDEAECKRVVDKQKQRIITLSKRANQPADISALEGTCIEAKIKYSKSGKTT